jgi:hypothetical protein
VIIKSGRKTLAFLGNFIPTTVHIQPDIVSGNDLYPMQTYEKKQIFLEEALQGKWNIAFQHDPHCYVGMLQQETSGELSVKCLGTDPIEDWV